MNTPTPTQTEPAPDPDPAEADRRVVDAIALFLAASPDWGADEIGEVANLIALVRPHPGGIAEPDLPAYAAALFARNDPTPDTAPKEHQP